MYYCDLEDMSVAVDNEIDMNAQEEKIACERVYKLFTEYCTDYLQNGSGEFVYQYELDTRRIYDKVFVHQITLSKFTKILAVNKGLFASSWGGGPENDYPYSFDCIRTTTQHIVYYKVSVATTQKRLHENVLIQ